MALLKRCEESRDGGGVGSVSFDLDFEDLVAREDKKELDDERRLDGDNRCARELYEVFSSIFRVAVRELDKSMGMEVTVGSFDGGTSADDRLVDSWMEGGGLEEVVLPPLVVGLTLRLEQLSPVSSSTPFLTSVFSPDMELVSSSSFTLVDDDEGAPLPPSTNLSAWFDVSSPFDGGASGILKASPRVAAAAAALEVTVVYGPRRFPLRRMRSAGSWGE